MNLKTKAINDHNLRNIISMWSINKTEWKYQEKVKL